VSIKADASGNRIRRRLNLRPRKLIEDYRKPHDKLYKWFSSSNKIRVIKLRLGWTCNNVEEGEKISAGNIIIWNT
jgi:hypothetical protein